jgi:hypothetical protein
LCLVTTSVEGRLLPSCPRNSVVSSSFSSGTCSCVGTTPSVPAVSVDFRGVTIPAVPKRMVVIERISSYSNLFAADRAGDTMKPLADRGRRTITTHKLLVITFRRFVKCHADLLKIRSINTRSGQHEGATSIVIQHESIVRCNGIQLPPLFLPSSLTGTLFLFLFPCSSKDKPKPYKYSHVSLL